MCDIVWYEECSYKLPAYYKHSIADFSDSYVSVYLDDLLIFSKSEKNQLKYVHMISECLNNAGYHVKIMFVHFFY